MAAAGDEVRSVPRRALRRSRCSRPRFPRLSRICVSRAAQFAGPEPSLERAFRGHRGGVAGLAFNPNMRQLVSVGLDGDVLVWNFKPSLRAYRFAGHTARGAAAARGRAGAAGRGARARGATLR